MSMQFFHSFLSSKSVITCGRQAGNARYRPSLPTRPCRASRAGDAPAPPSPLPPAHRQTAPGVAHSQKGVVVTVAEVGCAACQLGPAAILAVVVGQGAIVHHHRDVREHTLRPRLQLLHSQPSLPSGRPPRPNPWRRLVPGPGAYLRGLVVGVRVQENGQAVEVVFASKNRPWDEKGTLQSWEIGAVPPLTQRPK